MRSKSIIDSFCKSPTETNMDSLIDIAYNKDFGVEDTVYLAQKLASSGDQLIFKSSRFKADIPSTGGPSSLSTLFCPLVLKEMGFIVPKLGVEGRPAGGIDILGQLPGYKIDYTLKDVKDILLKNDYCHFIINDTLAPLDRLLFSHRSRGKGKSNHWLVIASILSKKIAVGIDIVGLDIRIGKFGNFGYDMQQANSNSSDFVESAKVADIRAKCFLNDFTFVQKPFIGRGEALTGMYELFFEQPNHLLLTHYQQCVNMATDLGKEYLTVNPEIQLSNIKQRFIENIEVQGSSLEEFESKAKFIKDQHQFLHNAETDGMVCIDLVKLRSLISKFQKNENEKFGDKCGVILLASQKMPINRGEPIMSYRIDNLNKPAFVTELAKAVYIKSTSE